ncbi:hypothetical protein [Amycolatopsis saalfeldensis]|uniref:Uncharacterized protein n=1 Tax=Amycolatopsis saalfeldensis TaxID=394193 RepID=A0A1H8YQE5_9PSEU|nr:hypothetical protein [Amycolatopsis saalfeldensis]SEP53588.1 hypothetical protein SAMN04489732_12913 [Amycolatopsis saalfeldensis]
MDLTIAIQKVTAEYVVPADQIADPGEVAWEIRGAVTAEEVGSWPLTAELIEAYRAVVQADAEEITAALRGVAK